MTSQPDVLVQRMWERYAGVAAERVAVLQTCERALVDGTATQQQRRDAVLAAHKLSGALGTYGRPGSEAARELEALLAREGDPSRIPGLVEALRRAVHG